ncbi:GTP-binding protein Di-Ras2-like [Styela clava]|uniref:GTP-binding protein Di-Ras2-like n=1 Tax=Styela clava TaxID=7725 RepID=UPI001939AA86|nr:GTP-binding protein Di-Ras2-like [Styela clava]
MAHGRSLSLPTLQPLHIKPKRKRASEFEITPVPSHRLRSMPEQSNDYRVVVFGAGGVGKSSLVLRFIKGTFRESYVPTIEDTYRQVINCDKNICTLQITDTTGSHHFPAMQRLSITRGHAFILVYSITSRQSMEELLPIYEQIKTLKHSMDDVPLVLVGNKCDEIERSIPSKEGESIARSWHCPFLETSAKNNYNVQELFQQLLELEKSRNISLNTNNRQRKKKADKRKEKLKTSCTVQ